MNNENLKTLIEVFKNKLRNGIVKFVYTKKNGEERHATGTLMLDIIEEHNATPKGTGSEMPLDIIKYFDVDKEGWRSFSVYDFVKYEE